MKQRIRTFEDLHREIELIRQGSQKGLWQNQFLEELEKFAQAAEPRLRILAERFGSYNAVTEDDALTRSSRDFRMVKSVIKLLNHFKLRAPYNIGLSRTMRTTSSRRSRRNKSSS